MTLPLGTTALLALLLGYFFGSIPFGLLLVRAAGRGDVRDVGSGNIGATNVLRAAGKGIAAATLVLDALKGWAAIAAAMLLWGAGEDWAALGAFLGHCFPVWLGFKGGKGVATLIGIALGLHWTIGLAVIVTWLAVAKLSRISSLGGMAAAVAAPLAALAFGYTIYLPVLAALLVITLLRHRANIARLMDGTEPRIGSKG
ncbi:glycerol-3-phosphate 1-O-acyltransferase PlsY [Croceibacterium sp. TMG7-5b_MA50]|uniref:glycerol-3-phosphate 1-O-acyltransferase PlsY n=1 Tax=Croceibacterium sp. TMG7-5b_MA50 TaxID=3121290 RepID=UPI0032213A6D